MEKNVLLSIRNITKVFPGVKAIDRVSLDVKRGEVHALVGENGAGKSTLVNIISGVIQPDEGELVFDGQPYAPANPREAQARGVGLVHQETALCPHLSVAENVFLGRMPHKAGGLVDFKAAWLETNKLLQKFSTELDPKAKVEDLSVANQQLVEIVKALSQDCRLLILDEPTSSLTDAETENLFRIIGELKERGISILYISHRLKEVFRICERITILRDGVLVKTLNTSETNEEAIICQMVGRNIDHLYPAKKGKTGAEILRVENISGHRFRNISFSLKKGEILGFAGLVGAGRSEVARAVCGIDPLATGQIYLNGQKVRFNTYYDAIRTRVAYLTEDRKNEGLFLKMSVVANLVVTSLREIAHQHLVHQEKERSLAARYVEKLQIKTADLFQRMINLSGGNQQKVVVGKWLAIDPVVLFMDEPTRGIDVGAKTELHYLMRELCDRGIGIVLISSELPEIIGMCDRVIVMNEGCIAGELVEEEITEQNIMRLAATQSNQSA